MSLQRGPLPDEPARFSLAVIIDDDQDAMAEWQYYYENKRLDLRKEADRERALSELRKLMVKMAKELPK